MSHFYGSIPTSTRKREATAGGHKSTGLVVRAASHDGAVEVHVEHDLETGRDIFTVRQVPHLGCGVERIVAEGIIGK
jgi:hypothetical protein